MKRDELVVEERMATWRDEAHERAKQDVKDEGLYGEEAEEFFHERMAYHYAELEKVEIDDV